MTSYASEARKGETWKDKVYTVSELTKEIRSLFECSFPPVWVEGEISNFKAHPSGHFYFSLKDGFSQLKCVMFSRENLRLSFRPDDGMKVLSRGSLGVYERGGIYQLIVSEMKPSGLGELAVKFEALKRRLAEEGLFEPQHKLSIPEYPESIGIVTSPSGAAIRDMVQVARRRSPGVALILRPTRVQGEGAAEEIAQAIDDFNRFEGVDLIIVGRGGGSVEDLWAFNEELVARAIYSSSIPIIAAVGHETDVTIADFVADLRAPTPSAGAELALKERGQLLERIAALRLKAEGIVGERIASSKERLRGLLRSYGLRRPADLVSQSRQTLDELTRRLSTKMVHILQFAREQLSSQRVRLEGLSPASILSRGYSICWKLPQRVAVTDSQVLSPGDRVEIKFLRGGAGAVVEKRTEEARGGSEF